MKKKIVNFRCTNEEYDSMVLKAKASGMSFTRYAKLILNSAPIIKKVIPMQVKRLGTGFYVINYKTK